MNLSPLFICLFVALFGAIFATGGGGHKGGSVGSVPIDVKMAESSSVHKKGGQKTIQLLFVKGNEKLDDDKETLDESNTILKMNYEAARLPYTTNEWIQENEPSGGVNELFKVPDAEPKSLHLLIKWCEEHQDKVPTPKEGEAESWRKTDEIPDWVMGISSNVDDQMLIYVEEIVKQKKETEKAEAKKMKQPLAGASVEDAEDENKREAARVPKWANRLMKNDLMTFFQLIKVTSHMDVKVLLNILTETVRFNLMWRTPEYIESVFGVHPFPNEKKQEEKPVHSEWAFELTPEEEAAMQVDAIGGNTVAQPELTMKG